MTFEDYNTREKAYDQLVGAPLGDRYEIVSVVSSGGTGDVLKVKHREIGRMYAAKVLRPAVTPKPDSLQRFRREAQILCKLRHPNIVTVHSFGIDEKLGPYLIMDLLEGVNLSSLVRKEGPLPLERASKLLIGICDGMSEAHQIGIVHRDIKPSNVMIVGEGKEQRAVIIDFGAGKLLTDEEQQQKLTQTNAILGTPMYMAPEQCLSRTSDKRTDVYAMGCLMYEVLTGKPPFKGESTFDLMQKQINEIPPPPSVANPGARIPQQIDQMITMALKKEPSERLDTFSKIKEALELAMQRPTYAKMFGSTLIVKPSAPKIAKRTMVMAAATLALLCLAAAFVFTALSRHPEQVVQQKSLVQLMKEREAFQQARKWDEAAAVSEQMLLQKNDPDHVWALAYDYYNGGRYDQALKVLPRLYTLSGRNSERFAALGRFTEADIYIHQNRNDEAGKIYTSLIAHPEFLRGDELFMVYYNMILCEGAAHDLKKAEAFARKALELAPSPSHREFVRKRLADALKLQGHVPNALLQYSLIETDQISPHCANRPRANRLS